MAKFLIGSLVTLTVPGLVILPDVVRNVLLAQFPRMRVSQVAENPDSCMLASELKLSQTTFDLLS